MDIDAAIILASITFVFSTFIAIKLDDILQYSTNMYWMMRGGGICYSMYNASDMDINAI